MVEPAIAAPENPATARHPARDPAVQVGVLILVIGCVVMPFGSVAWPANPSFMPAFGSVTAVIDLITCLLLFSQARSAHDRPTGALATAYLFSALTIIPHLAAFPGVFAAGSLIGDSASAVWLWCIWHGGFALCVARYALAARSEGAGPAGSGPPVFWPQAVLTVAVIAAATVLVTAGLPLLPTILVGTGFGRLNALGIGPTVLLCNVAALILVVVRLRGRSVLSRWLAVAMIASTLDVTLTLLGSGRYTVGWYAARCLSLVTGIVILVALLHELTALFARAARANRDLEALSLTDGLTGLPNRRAFDRALATEWRSAQRLGTSLALLMIDIDHFKGFNDRFGHPVGDLCLRLVAQAVGVECRRGRDLGARFGGEEFAILLPDTDAEGARIVAELVRDRVSRIELAQDGRSFGTVTASIGVAARSPVHQRDQEAGLLGAADQALYQAKREGRNRVVAEPRSAPPYEPARPLEAVA